MIHENYNTKTARLLGARLGYNSSPSFNIGGNLGLKPMAQRLSHMGGRTQQERMIRDKRRTLDKTLLYSYQAGFVKKVYGELDFVPENIKQPPVRALINPDKNKMDYDDKIISIPYEHGFEPGDVFEWVNTGSHWLIYLQDKDELAYFRGEIRRCRYTINYKNEQGKICSTYAALKGPVETRINYIQKSGISMDLPNLSIYFLLPYNKSNLDFFKRYSEFYIVEDDNRICWRVEAVDWISTPGIIEVNAVEYYSNTFEDDIEKGIVGGLIAKKENPNNAVVEDLISGDTFIKPKGMYQYTYTGLLESDWEIDTQKYPIKYREINDNTINLIWTAGHSGQFEIKNNSTVKTVVVESLF